MASSQTRHASTSQIVDDSQRKTKVEAWMVKVRVRIKPKHSGVRVRRKKKTSSPRAQTLVPDRQKIKLKKGEVCFECYDMTVNPKQPDCYEFRLLNEKREVLGMGTLFGPDPRETARLLFRGKVGVILVGRKLERWEPK